MGFPIPKLPTQIYAKDSLRYIPDDGEYDTTKGLWVENLGEEILFKGGILPLIDEDLKYLEGTYTSRDRKIYTHFNGLSPNDIVKYKTAEAEEVYIVTAESDYEEIGTNFHRHILKRKVNTKR